MPDRIYAIDCETASRLDVRVAGAWAYSLHPSTEVLMLAWADADNGGPVKLWLPGKPVPAELQGAAGIVAHNAEFELAIWRNVLRRHAPGWPDLAPEQVHCTAAQAAALGLPRSLDQAGAALKLNHRKQASSGTRLVNQFSHIKANTERKTPEGNPKDWQEFIEYCKADVETCREIWRTLPKLSPFERKIFVAHLKINARGIGCDIPRAAKLQGLCDYALRRMAEGSLGYLLSRPLLLQTWLSCLGCEVADCREATLEAALPTAPPAARELIMRRLEFAKASVKKFRRMLLANAGDHVLRGLHVFFGAHTGRFSGALIQPQNLVRACVKDIDYNIELLDRLPDDPAAAVDILGGPGATLTWASWMTRPMLTADPGKLLVGADFKAIEARVLAWLTGATRMLELYRSGADPYRDMAGSIFKVSVQDVTGYQRWVGKQVVLGCVASGTPVLTRRGWLPIETLAADDQLWDGWQWASHGGLLAKGIKPVFGPLTADHRVWIEGRWRQWADLQNVSLIRRAAASAGLPPLQLVDKAGPTCLLNAIAAGLQQLIFIIWPPGERPNATAALSSHLPGLIADISYKLVMFLVLLSLSGQKAAALRSWLADIAAAKDLQTAITCAHILMGIIGAKAAKGSENGRMNSGVWSSCSTICTTVLNTIPVILTGRSAEDGRILPASWPMSSGCQDMAFTRCLTDGTIPEAIARLTVGSSAIPFRTSTAAETYDILDCGPLNRFTILTSEGPLLVHNCGYGMGRRKFAARCLLEGQEVSPELAKTAVNAFRATVTEIPLGWRAIDDAIAAVMQPEEWDKGRFLFGGKLIVWTVSHGGVPVSLNFRLPDGSIIGYKYPRYITIPSLDLEREDSRQLTWLTAQRQSSDPGIGSLIRKRCEEALDADHVIDPAPYLARIGRPELEGFRRVSAWGGKIIENLVQKISRNLLAEAILRIDRQWPIRLHVHDEIVCQVERPEEEMEVKAVMEIRPEWIRDAPIEVETWCGERYRK